MRATLYAPYKVDRPKAEAEAQAKAEQKQKATATPPTLTHKTSKPLQENGQTGTATDKPARVRFSGVQLPRVLFRPIRSKGRTADNDNAVTT